MNAAGGDSSTPRSRGRGENTIEGSQDIALEMVDIKKQFQGLVRFLGKQTHFEPIATPIAPQIPAPVALGASEDASNLTRHPNFVNGAMGSAARSGI